MSIITELKGKLTCSICPFMECNEAASCYHCKCFLDDGIELDDNCDNFILHSECPLATGLKVIITQSDDGQLQVGKTYI
jgi:hypothetical protein